METTARRVGLALVTCMLGVVALRAAYLVCAENPANLPGDPSVDSPYVYVSGNTSPASIYPGMTKHWQSGATGSASAYIQMTSGGTPGVFDGRGPGPSSHDSEPETSELDAELARLYVACPASASIPIDQAANYNFTPYIGEGRLPPVSSLSPHPSHQERGVVRLPSVEFVAQQASATEGEDSSGQWLVDPNEWYAEGEQEEEESDEAVESDAAAEVEEEIEATEPGETIEEELSEEESSGPQLGPIEPIEPQERDNMFLPSEPVESEKTFSEQLEDSDLPAQEATPEPPKPLPPVETAPPVETIEEIAPPPAAVVPDRADAQVDPHLELFAKTKYPSARQCATCHKKQYDEWSTSSHAYSAISPMFHKFEQKINDLSRGTIGYFCMRCHAPVATAMCESRATPLWEMAEVAREGVTCIACHRVQYRYGKTNGERRIETGDIFAPVFGNTGGEGVAEVIARKDHFKVKTSPHDKGPGQDMHRAGIYFDQINKSEFCSSCHQVSVQPGIKLEVVWEQYRASPACKQGISCQDCHMGTVPGVPSGYELSAIAEIDGKVVNSNRKHANHVFYGPGYSIAHPGIFPWNLKANRWSMRDWLLFDHRAGWGTEDFEDGVADGSIQVEFPPVWREVDDRYDAREIVEENLKKLAGKRDLRRQVLENGSHVDGPFFDAPPTAGADLDFHYVVTNTNPGHNLPSGSLGAQPQLWANVVLIAPDGRRIWESGYTDSYGDVADIHSYDVRHKRVPYDWQLFNLQTMFLITGVKGTDREFFLPINLDIDQLPFIRPGTLPITTTNHPPFIRMESRSLAPLGSRRAKYRVPGELLCQKGTYRLSFRLRSRTEPIYFMRFVEATVEMQRAMNEWMVDVHPQSIEFYVR